MNELTMAEKITKADNELTMFKDARRVATVPVANRLAQTHETYEDDNGDIYESSCTVDKETGIKEFILTRSAYSYDKGGNGWQAPITNHPDDTETVDEFAELLIGGLLERWLKSLKEARVKMAKDTDKLTAINKGTING